MVRTVTTTVDIKTICERCKAVYETPEDGDNSELLNWVELIFNQSARILEALGGLQFDLCPKCTTGFITWFMRGD